MNKLIRKISIFIIMLALSQTQAESASLSGDYIINQAENSIKSQVNTIVKGSVTADITSMPYKTIEVPSGRVKIVTTLNLNHFSPLTVAKVKILVGGNEIKSFGVPVKLSVSDNVWVANDTVNYGETLSGASLSLEKRDLGFLAESAAREKTPVNTYIAKKTFRPGEIIDSRYLETTPVIVRNTLVSVVFSTSDDITVTITAQALENGKMGDFIRVRSKEYKKEYIGKVISQNTILVNI